MDVRRRYSYAAIAAVVIATVLLAFTATSYAADNSGCLSCHSQVVGSLPAYDFSVPPVNRDTACRKCHIPGLVGTHPYHQIGSNCGAACHQGWGDTLMTAVPYFYDPVSVASFASSASKNAPSSLLHLIHATPRWPERVNTPKSACSSCHATAACTACHEGAVSAGHASHGASQYPAWSGTVGRGVTGIDQTQRTAGPDTNQCATAGCHGLEATRARKPALREDYSHAVGGNPYDPTVSNTVVTTGTWNRRFNSLRTGGHFSFSNAAGATHSITFRGTRIELISDRDPFRGRAEVYINDVLYDVIDCYSPTTQLQAVVFTASGLPSGRDNTIRVRVLNQKQPAARATFVVIDAYRVYSDLPASIAPSCTSCHGDLGDSHGGDFDHVATQTVGVYPGPAPDYPCTTCHSMGLFTEHARASSSRRAAGCSACHTAYAPYRSAGYNGTCTWSGCHQAANGHLPHASAAIDHIANDAATTQCRACHGSDLALIHDDSPGNTRAVASGSNGPRIADAALRANSWNTGCTTCHGATRFPTTTDCTSSGCHVGSGVVSMETHPAPAHDASGADADVARTGGHACSTCHILELVDEHDKPSSRGAGNTTITCASCHTASYYPVGWADTPPSSNTCVACHPVAGGKAGAPHVLTSYTTKHDYSLYSGNASSCGTLAGAYCHGGASELLGDVRFADALHAPSKPGAATCRSCHTTNTGVPNVYACTTCHTVGHDVPLAHSATEARFAANAECLPCHASYADLRAHLGGCAGCHGNTTLTANGTRYLTGTFTGRCTSCHTGGVLGTVYSPINPNHYSEPIHSSPSMGTLVRGTTNGTVSATCSNCHNGVNPTGVDGWWAQHQGLQTSGSITCTGCHNYNAAVTALITNGTRDETCAACHTASVLGAGLAQHSSTNAPPVDGIEAQGAGTCRTPGCHSTLDLHELHKGKSGGKVTSCAIAGCHDFTKQGWKPTAKSCGTGGACHTTEPHDMSKHISSDTGKCLHCHEGSGGTPVTDVRYLYRSAGYGGTLVHACSTCHNGGANLGATKTSDCISCHNGVDVRPPRTYHPYGTAHYSETTHTASQVTTGTYGSANGQVLRNWLGQPIASWSVGCPTCHTTSLRTEHNKTSVSFPATTTAMPDRCVQCHELRVDQFTARWTKSCGGQSNNCHNMTSGQLHNNWAAKHDASTQVMSAPGSSVTRANTTVVDENWGTGTTWPTAWTRSDTTNVTVVTGGRTGSQARITSNSTTRTTRSFQRTLNLSAFNDGVSLSVWYRTEGLSTTTGNNNRDWVRIEFSPDNGSTWRVLEEISGNVAAWTNFRSGELPANSQVIIRFSASFNAASGEFAYFDDIRVEGSTKTTTALPAGSTALASCQNNPSGAECHIVTDVASIHSGLPNFGCTVCHNNTQHPTTAQLNCQATGCHVGINRDHHDANRHATAFSDTTVFGTGFASTFCSGCHDDGIDDEHELAKYASTPCSICHRKTADSGPPVSVRATATAAAIGKASGTALCTDCHGQAVGGTVRKDRIHVLRQGWNGAPHTGSAAIGGVQFNDAWSGHRVYDSMPGMKTSFTTAVDGVTATWSTPSAANMLSNWSPLTETTTMPVRCNDCHGSVTGATGPHGAAMRVRMDPAYPAPYTSAYITTGNAIASDIPGAGLPICAKCHNVTNLFNGTANGNVHNRGDHKGVTGGKCNNCHVRTPHAWKRPRLIGYMSDPPAYQSLMVQAISQGSKTPTGWNDSGCAVVGCGSHGAIATPWP